MLRYLSIIYTKANLTEKETVWACFSIFESLELKTVMKYTEKFYLLRQLKFSFSLIVHQKHLQKDYRGIFKKSNGQIRTNKTDWIILKCFFRKIKPTTIPANIQPNTVNICKSCELWNQFNNFYSKTFFINIFGA